MVIVGNAMKRGNPCVEYVLIMPSLYIRSTMVTSTIYCVIVGYWRFQVHMVKPQITGMLTWILEQNGLKPGFLIGGIAGNFGTSARLGESEFFVIEADEYDTAFLISVLNLYITIRKL